MPLPRALLAVAATAALVAGCGGGSPATPAKKPGKALDFKAAPSPAGGAGGVKAVEVASGFKEPTYVTAIPGKPDDLAVLERGGRIDVVSAGKRRPEPLADLSSQVSTEGGEQGLLGLAFAPDYPDSGLAYVYFTDKGDDIRIVELRRDGSRRTVLKIHHPTTTPPGTPKTSEDLRVHNGGQVAFGPDGLLYIGTGDGGGQGDPANRAQNTSLLLGKILRIDPRRTRRPEIYATGLRNPYRFSFDPASGDLIIGDVGQNHVEEIDVIPRGDAGENLGWSCFEGTRRFKPCQVPDMLGPVIQRPSSAVAKRCASITGGLVVRGAGIPALEGRYVYTDFCEGLLRTAIITGAKASDDKSTGLTIPAVSSFGAGADGKVYVTAYVRGALYRLAAAD